VLAERLTQAGHIARVRELVQHYWRAAATYQDMWALLLIANSFVVAEPALLATLLRGADWAAEFPQNPT
jgi:hypothetical protein